MTTFTIPHNPIRSTITAVSYEAPTVTTPDGRPGTLAIIDADGNVVESGSDIAAVVRNVSIESYRNFLIGHGYLKVLSGPPQIPTKAATK